MTKSGPTLIACLVLLLFAVPVRAATVVGLGPGVSYTINGATQTGTDVDLQALTASQAIRDITHPVSIGFLTLLHAAIVTGDDTSGSLQNIRPAGVGPSEHYLAAYGANIHSSDDGYAVFDLTSSFNTLSFVWGSVDGNAAGNNVASFINNNDDEYIIRGADILAAVGGLTESVSSVYFTFTDMVGIKKFSILSHNAFEIAKITASNIPLPAALPLFAMALAGLYGFRRMQRKTA